MNLLDIINKAKAENAKTLDLSQQGLRLLPRELFEIQSLEELITHLKWLEDQLYMCKTYMSTDALTADKYVRRVKKVQKINDDHCVPVK